MILTKCKIIIFTALFLFPAASPVFSKTIILDTNLKEISAGLYMHYLVDREGKLNIEDIENKKNISKWIRSEKEYPGFGYTHWVYWVWLKVKNASAKDMKFYLEQNYPLTDDIRLYIKEKSGFRMIKTGDTYPFSSRPYNHRNFVFPLRLKAEEVSAFYLRYETGGSMNIVLKIWSPQYFRDIASLEKQLLTLFYGIIFVFIIYNLIIYFFIKRIEYLYYSLFIMSFLLLMMSVNGTAFQVLWPDLPVWNNKCLPLSQTTTTLFLILFCVELVELKRYGGTKYRIALLSSYATVLAIAVVLIAPYYIATILANVLMGYVIILITIIGSILIIKEKNRAAILGLISASAIIFGGIVYLIKSFGILPTNFITSWSLHIGSVFMVIMFSITLADRINVMRMNVQKTEKKYRNIVESSPDIIFSLDENLNFLSVNSAIEKNLGFKAEDVIGENFMDFIKETWSEKEQISRMIVKEYINDLMRTKGSVVFITDFKVKYSSIALEMSVKLDYSDIIGEKERILGKVSPVLKDKSLKYLKKEKQTYEMDNFLDNVDFFSQRLTRNLNKYMEPSEIIGIRISLREILINAIEHGNLNINFDEKTKAMEGGNYFRFIQNRQKNSLYIDKKVLIDYHLTSEKVEYLITDEGEGFEHKSIDESLKTNADEGLLAHGRGLLMAGEIFDVIKFNKKGNQVLLIKKINSKNQV